MAGTLPTNYLDPLNWGASASGSAGVAETTLTLGTDRLDVRVPIDQYNISGLQITRAVNLLISMSQYFGGGTRLRIDYQSGNPFAANERGLWIDSNFNVRYSNAGTLNHVPYGQGTAKGDMFVFNGSTFTKVALGSNGTVLTADNTTTGGIKWAAAGGGGGVPSATTKGDIIVYDGASYGIVSAGADGTLIRARAAASMGIEWVTPATYFGLSTKGDIIAYTGSAVAAVSVGTNGQILSSDSTQPAGLRWISVSTLPGGSVKGDIVVYNGSSYTVLSAGANGTVLTANSGSTDGINWASLTLALAYSSGSSSADSILALSSTNGPVVFKDAASSIGALLSGTNNAGSTTYFSFTGNSSHILRSGVVNGSSAVGLVLDTVNDLSNATAKTISFRNAGTEYLSFIVSNGSDLLTINPPTSYQVSFVANNGNGAGFQTESTRIKFVVSGGTKAALYATDLSPVTDFGIDLGQSATRWKALYGQSVHLTDASSSAGSLVVGTNNAGSTTYFNLTGNSSHTLRSPVSNGTSAVGLIIDTVNDLSNATAKVVSLRTAGVEGLSIGIDQANGYLNMKQISIVDGPNWNFRLFSSGVTTGSIGSGIQTSVPSAGLEAGVPSLELWSNGASQFTISGSDLSPTSSASLGSVTAFSSISAIGQIQGGTIKVIGGTLGSRPSASSSIRGAMYLAQGGAGVADALYICVKDASDAYGWKTVTIF